MANPQNKLRVMCDANLLIAGIGWPRFPYEVLQHAAKGDYQLVLCSFIIQEARKALLKIIPEYPDALDTFLELSGYENVPTPSQSEIDAYPDLVRDPKDIPIALAAINSGVNMLISQDKDFTAQDETTQALREQLHILLPGTFLREHMDWTSEELETIRRRTWDDM